MSRKHRSSLAFRAAALFATALIVFAVLASAGHAAVGRTTRHRVSALAAEWFPVSITHLTASKTPARPRRNPAYDTTHTVVRGESLPAIVHRYLPRTRFMTGSGLERAIRAANPQLKGIWPKPGSSLLIPGYQRHWSEKPVPVSRNFEVRAVYLTGAMAGSAKGLEIIRRWRQLGGNSVVFDIKDSDGVVSVPTGLPLAPRQKYYPIRNLSKFTSFLHAQGMHVIARIAIFRDEKLVAAHPELAVQSRTHPGPWRENGKPVWTDPSHPKIWEYNIGLAKYAAAHGVDEIQFDYVRFPAEGDQADARFAYQAEHPGWQRSDVIVDFLRRAQAELRPSGVLLSLDVFGVMAWQRPIDLSHTGQDIARMARYCDVLSPMIYPSHFFGMDGYKTPGDAPGHFIAESMDRFRKATAGSGVVLRPWLQAFAWRTRSYSAAYIRTQVEVSRAHGADGFLFWNANNDYSKPFAAMPEMSRDKSRFFRGDELRSLAEARPKIDGRAAH